MSGGDRMEQLSRLIHRGRTEIDEETRTGHDIIVRFPRVCGTRSDQIDVHAGFQQRSRQDGFTCTGGCADHVRTSDRIFDAGMQARTSLFRQTDGARRRDIPVPQPDVIKGSDMTQCGDMGFGLFAGSKNGKGPRILPRQNIGRNCRNGRSADRCNRRTTQDRLRYQSVGILQHHQPQMAGALAALWRNKTDQFHACGLDFTTYKAGHHAKRARTTGQCHAAPQRQFDIAGADQLHRFAHPDNQLRWRGKRAGGRPVNDANGVVIAPKLAAEIWRGWPRQCWCRTQPCRRAFPLIGLLAVLSSPPWSPLPLVRRRVSGH